MQIQVNFLDVPRGKQYELKPETNVLRKSWNLKVNKK